jgi:hypothetical protein
MPQDKILQRELDVLEIYVEKEHMISLGERLHWHLKNIGNQVTKDFLIKEFSHGMFPLNLYVKTQHKV